MANEGSDDKKQDRPSSGPREDRTKPRRRRRGRRSGDRPKHAGERQLERQQGTNERVVDAPNPKGDKTAGRDPQQAREELRSGGKSRGRRRRPRKERAGEPRKDRETCKDRETRNENDADPVESKSTQRRRRPKREEIGRGRRSRQARPQRRREDKPPRWSQTPPPVAKSEESAVKPAHTRPPKYASPVFLKNSSTIELDEDTLIDFTPWAAEFDEGDGDGTLYNTVIVRGERSKRSRTYDAGDGVFDRGDVVAIEGEAGRPGTGVVVQPNRREMIRGRLPRVTRRLHPNEISCEPRSKRREQEVFRIARHVASTLGLPIKIVRSQAEPSGKIVVFFATEKRIDFREFYRRVSAAAQGRVELRQVGVRDAAKMLGGVAPCGLKLCCSTFLREFAPVSIKMAKEQGLVLNPQRVSGLCGRLLCCLTYEDALYRKQRKLLPKLGKRVFTPRGPGRVRDVDVLSQTIRVSLESGEIMTAQPADIQPMFPSQRQAPGEGEQHDRREDRRSRSDRKERRRHTGEEVSERRRRRAPESRKRVSAKDKPSGGET